MKTLKMLCKRRSELLSNDSDKNSFPAVTSCFFGTKPGAPSVVVTAPALPWAKLCHPQDVPPTPMGTLCCCDLLNLFLSAVQEEFRRQN